MIVKIEEIPDTSGQFFAHDKISGFHIQNNLSTALFGLYQSTEYWLNKEDVILQNDPFLKINTGTRRRTDINSIAEELINYLIKTYSIEVDQKTFKDTFWVLIPSQHIPDIIKSDPKNRSSQAYQKNETLIFEGIELGSLFRQVQFFFQKKIAYKDLDSSVAQIKVNLEIPLKIFESNEAFENYFSNLGLHFEREEIEYTRIYLSN